MNLRDSRHEQVKRIFLEACAVSAEARGAFLERACEGDAALREEVQRLLVADESFHGDAPLPERLGTYRIVRRIGIGGMGIVYEGEQEDPRRRVAIKVLRASVSSRQGLQRFQLEAEMLGRLQHPGIAQIFAVRTLSSGEGEQPYLVTELIEGASRPNCGYLIDAYHFTRSGAGGRGFENVPGEKIYCFQYSDLSPNPVTGVRRPTDRLPPGKGVVKWREMLGLLAEKGYTGYLSYEAPNPEQWARSPYDVAREGVELTRKLLRDAVPSYVS